MTLREKFGEVYVEKGMAKELEKIADNHALEFIEWLGANNYKKYSNGWANMFTKATPEKELLEIFKKEKSL
jgi:hypothetical protein